MGFLFASIPTYRKTVSCNCSEKNPISEIGELIKMSNNWASLERHPVVFYEKKEESTEQYFSSFTYQIYIVTESDKIANNKISEKFNKKSSMKLISFVTNKLYFTLNQNTLF